MKEFNLTQADLSRLENCFINEPLARQMRLFRVNNQEGGELIAQNGYRDYSGIIIPYFLPNEDNPIEYRLRRDNPEFEQKSDGILKEKNKYLSPPGRGNLLYFPPKCKRKWLEDVSIPVVITEGEKKQAALWRIAVFEETQDVSQEIPDGKKPKFFSIGLSGVWNWRGTVGKKTNETGRRVDVKGVIPQFNDIIWQNRTVIIVFDTNVQINDNVNAARRTLAKELKSRGAQVFLVDLPQIPEINGMDDLLGLWEREYGTEKAVEKGLQLLNEAKPFEEKTSQATRILQFIEGLELFHTPEGEGFASIEQRGHIEHRKIRSKSFRIWLSYQFFQQEKQLPSTQALQDVTNMLEGRAIFEGEQQEVHLRLSSFDDKIYLDLCNDAWQIIEIDKRSWRIIESKNAPVKFRRVKSMLPLPMPTESGSVEKLRKFLNANEENLILLLAWLIGCFRPNCPYPVLVLSGEQGTAKSTTSRILRELVDPNQTHFRSSPRDERDLVIAANNAWVCAFDNLSNIPTWLSDALCRISTGGGFGTRTLYENDEETVFAAKRPILLNGIGDLATRSDLLDRSLLVQLEPIPEHKRKTEREFWDEFNQEKAEIFSGLLSAVVIALEKIDSIKLNILPRMADFATWATAAESGLGLRESAFLSVYMKNRDEAHDIVLEGSPIADIIKAFMVREESFDGTMKELLQKLNQIADDDTKKNKEFPKSERGLRSKLNRIAPNLRAIGINIQFLDRTSKGRPIRLEYSRMQSSQPSPSSISPELRFQNDDDSKTTLGNDDNSTVINEYSTIKSSSNGHFTKTSKTNDFNTKGDGNDGSEHNLSVDVPKCKECGLEMSNFENEFFCSMGCNNKQNS